MQQSTWKEKSQTGKKDYETNTFLEQVNVTYKFLTRKELLNYMDFDQTNTSQFNQQPRGIDWKFHFQSSITPSLLSARGTIASTKVEEIVNDVGRQCV